MTWQQHIINRQVLEFRISRDRDHYALQEEMAQIYKEYIVPMIDEYLSAYSSPDVIDRIDRLELDLGKLDRRNLRETFIKQVAQQLDEQLPRLLNEAPTLAIQQPQEIPVVAPAFSQPIEIVFGKQPEAFVTDPSDSESGVPDPAEGKREEVANTTAFRNSQSNAVATGPGETTRSRMESNLELIGFYLHNGSFPWWAKVHGSQAFRAAVTDVLETHASRLRELLSRSLTHAAARKRFIYSSDDELLQQLVKTYAPRRIPTLKKIQTEWLHLAATAAHDRASVRLDWWSGVLPLIIDSETRGKVQYPAALVESVLAVIAPDQQVEQLVKPLRLLGKIASEFGLEELGQVVRSAERNLKKITRESTAPPGPKKRTVKSEKTPAVLSASQQTAALLEELRFRARTTGPLTDFAAPGDRQKHYDAFSDSDTIPVDNAGLVLLGPFLARFFEKLGLLQDGHWVNETAHEKACVMLHFLVAGDAVTPFEAELPLIKLLCGIPFGQPLNLDHTITKEDKEAAEGLLEAVIGYIPKLNNLSIDGFRGSFLVREGIIASRDGNWLLRVQRKPYDLLLDSVPWNFRQIRLGWMEHLLNVEW
jgi:hypothetical protein